MKTQLLAENDGFLSLREVDLSNYDCYCNDKAITNWIEFSTRDGRIDLPKVKFEKDVNYEAVYNISTYLSINTNWQDEVVKIITSEDEIISKIEQDWNNKNFFNNPQNFYKLIETYAEINMMKVGGPHKTAVAAYNKLFNEDIKPKTMQEFSKIITARCAEPDLGSKINLTVDDKLLILHQLKPNKIPQAIFRSQIELIFKPITINGKNYLFPKDTCSLVNTSMDLCAIFMGNRVAIRSSRNDSYYREGTIVFTTGRCSDCANRRHTFASQAEIIRCIKGYDSTLVANIISTTTLSIRGSNTIIKNLINSLTICRNAIKVTGAKKYTITCPIDIAVTKSISINPVAPFHMINFEYSGDRNSLTLGRCLTTGNSDDLLGTFGIIAQCVKTLDNKKAALLDKLVKAYEVSEPIIRNFFLSCSLGRKKINTNQLAVKNPSNVLSFGASCSYVAIKDAAIGDFDNGFTPNDHTRVGANKAYVDNLLKPIFDRLKQEKLLYKIDDQRSRFIITILLRELLFMYLDLRRVNENFIRWDAEKPTLPVELDSYIENYILSTAGTILPRTIVLAFRND